MQSDVNFPLVLCKPTSQIIQPKFNQCKRFVLRPHFPFIYLTISILGSSIIFGLSLKYTLRFVPSIYIPEAGGSGTDANVLGTPFYGEPGSICSQTYICIGYDTKKHNFSKIECENIISYIKTKFFRYLVSIKKKTQHAFAQVYQFIPLQDFSKPWTDEELYSKYNLDMFEREYIESLINPMD